MNFIEKPKELYLPFETHSIYITLDDKKIYKLNEDFSKEEVKEVPHPSKENPNIVMHKLQFDFAKDFLLNKENPLKMSVKTARLYNKIGFISDLELAKFIEG
ncbi:hypothetical protein ATN24_13965 [Clostridium butyricum]|nr:hypothetical protein ATN24_13965 [Clostridium butyricum]ANF15706.1 hypothetical protein AZ909_12420 [Clostridium butyricum]NVO92975.1 hypothetical protein [Clostridium butyricum]RSC97413.1 hypothetical protein EI970_14070 [Clostridium butyricum]